MYQNLDPKKTSIYTPIYAVYEKKEPVISSPTFKWLNNNFVKANSGKSNLIMSCKNKTTAMIEIILGISIDHKLKPDEHGNYLCKMQAQEFNGLACIASFMDIRKKRSITKAFIESQFVCCRLICIFHGWDSKIK